MAALIYAPRSREPLEESGFARVGGLGVVTPLDSGAERGLEVLREA